ncbi:hypothetical protein PVAND_004893 [Polypedilum vanderplanki]|uniref:Ig-like domain-containing protein n=1 Tax=Polypedilum vanderplanki TaxID=319348 RepID=A0A9J6BZF5_POLVA|nr:hypothetical protein PVAND_004893 [Polypedilum vanderplanki]
MDSIIQMYFVGCIKINLKFIVILVILLSNNGSGLIAPVNVDKSNSAKLIIEHEKIAQNQSSRQGMDYGTNSINDEYMMELPVTVPSSSSSSLSSTLNINKTFFMSSNNSIVTSQVGSVVHLSCLVHVNGDETISWIRRKDYHLLTVGSTTYSSDERFSAIHYNETGDWQLMIKFVQLRDNGLYECAVSSHPSISLFVHLEVTESRAEIDGPIEKFLRVGSTLRLTCRVLRSIENPIYLFWYHNNRMINYDVHLGVNVTIEADNKFSELVIAQTTVNHSGNFTCAPSNAASASNVIHILNGENTIGLAAYGGAAGDSMNAKNQSIYVQTLLLLVIATYQFISQLQIS